RHHVKQQRKQGTKPSEVKLPVIFPFVIYTGKKPYDGTKRLIDAFDTPHLLYEMLESNYIIELQSETISHIMKDNEAGLAEVMLRESVKRDFCPLLDNNPEIRKLIEKSDYKHEIIMYILGHEIHSAATVLNKIEDLDKEEKTKIMSELRRIEQRGIRLGEERGIRLGEERGIKLGEERGKQRGFRETITKLLKNGMKKPQVANILEITLQKLEALLG
ncbi:MAG: Rpn family recombination-promoting nuclease/putative transposase, partial [Bacteroidota bacterium]